MKSLCCQLLWLETSESSFTSSFLMPTSYWQQVLNNLVSEPPLCYSSLTHCSLSPRRLLSLPNGSPCFCLYSSSRLYHSCWSDSSVMEVRSCHSAPAMFCLNKSKGLTVISLALDGLVPTMALTSSPNPLLLTCLSLPVTLALCSLSFPGSPLAPIICMDHSFTLGLCLLFTLSDRSLMISLCKIIAVLCHCVSPAFFLGSLYPHQTYYVFICLLSLSSH